MTERSPEIEAIVRRFMAARSAGDLDAVLNLYSTSEHLTAIGSDEGEWFQGRDDVLDNTRELWTGGPRVADTMVRIEAFENGDTGWATLEQTRATPEGKPHVYRVTFIFQLEAGAWKIILTHFAVLVSDEELNRVDLTPTLSGLLESLGHSEVVGDGLRHTGTVMFTDIVDSTVLSQVMGDQAWTAAINDHFATLREIVGGNGGHVVKTLGDGAMFLFPAGGASLDAGIQMQQILHASPDDSIRIRIGVHTGDLMQSDDDVIGLTVNKAARVAAAAKADQILVSATTAGMVNHNEYEFESPITVELKGIEGTHVLLPLTWGRSR